VLHTSLSNLAQMMIILMPVMKFHAISIASRNALALVHFMQRFTAADELFVNLCDNKAVSEVARVTTDGESDPGETGGVLLGLAPLLLNLEILSLCLSLYSSLSLGLSLPCLCICL